MILRLRGLGLACKIATSINLSDKPLNHLGHLAPAYDRIGQGYSGTS